MPDLFICHGYYDRLHRSYKDQLMTRVNLDSDHHCKTPGNVSMFVSRIMEGGNPDMLLAIDISTGDILGWVADFRNPESGPAYDRFVLMAYVTKKHRGTGICRKLLDILGITKRSTQTTQAVSTQT